VDDAANQERTNLNRPRALPPAALIELVRALARQAAREAFASASSPATSDHHNPEPEDRP
jgi:hypothetical protein